MWAPEGKGVVPVHLFFSIELPADVGSAELQYLPQFFPPTLFFSSALYRGFLRLERQ